MSSAVLDRAALYYPYIHVEPDKIDWLKATLLCFPQVRRMIPAWFNPKDPPEIREFQQQKNANGEVLFDSEYLNMSDEGSAPWLAQERLHRKLRQYEQQLVFRFSKWKGPSPESEPYKIYRGKIHPGIWEYLFEKKLAVAAEGPEKNPWSIYVEPQLGEAIMSTIAISLARAKGLDIVTSDSEIHNALLIQSEDEVFDALLNLRAPQNDMPNAEKVDELAQAVIQTRFDVTQLTAAQIAELHKEGKSLIAFKKALMPIAIQIPTIHDPEERKKRIQKTADEVIGEWEKYKSSLPGFAIAALVEAQEIRPPEYAISLVATGTAVWMPILGVGIALGVLSYKGYKIVKRFKEGTANPYNYLSQIQNKGAVLIGAPTLPAGHAD